MNKFKLLVAPLLVLPFVIGCNNGGGDKPEEAKFSLSSDPIEVVDKTATVKVDWTPTNIIRFESFTFTATPTKDNTVTFDPTGDPRPMTVKITFTEDITTNISGTLSFAYEDVTAKTKGESSLSVTIPKPEDPTLTKEEFDKAISFEGVQYLQVEEYVEVYSLNKELEFSPSVSHIFSHSDDFYDEFYCRKNATQPVTYDSCFKIDPTGDFDFSYNVEESNFTTPQIYWVGIFEKNLLSSIKLILGDDYYSDFEYVKTEGVYKAESTDGKVVLKFNNKKVVSYVIEPVDEEYSNVTATLTYLANTPEYPVEPGL